MTALFSATYKPLYSVENDNNQTNKGNQNAESGSFFDFLNIFSNKSQNQSTFSLLDETVTTIKNSERKNYNQGSQNSQTYSDNPLSAYEQLQQASIQETISSLSPEERAYLAGMLGLNTDQQNPGRPNQPVTVQPTQQNPGRPNQPVTVQPTQQNSGRPNQPVTVQPTQQNPVNLSQQNPGTQNQTRLVPFYGQDGKLIGYYQITQQNNPVTPNQPTPNQPTPNQQNPIRPVQPATIAPAQVNPVPTVSNAAPQNGKNYRPEETIGTAGDGRIGDFSQTINGDCWFLSSLKAVANDPQGERMLLNSIKRSNDGWTVNFPGDPNRTITVSQAELDQSKQWISDPINSNLGGYKKALGDDDVTILEIAAEKYFGGRLDGAKGKQEPEALRLLTGQRAMESGYIGNDNDTSINNAYNNNFLTLSAQERNKIEQIVSRCSDRDQLFEEVKNVASEELIQKYKGIRIVNKEQEKAIQQELQRSVDSYMLAGSACMARRNALQILNKLKNDPDQVSITAGGLNNLNDSNSQHAFSVKIDKATGNYLVSNPHNTNATPEVYTSDDALLNRYYEITAINDIR